MASSVYIAVLRRAAELLGGKAELRVRLRVAMRDLDAWMEGKDPPPRHVFLRAVDVISAELSGPPTDLVTRAQDLRSDSQRAVSAARATRARSDEAIARANVTVERSRAMLASLLGRPNPFAAARSPLSAQEFAATEFAAAHARAMIEAALNAAVSSTAASRANLQLASGVSLRIVGQLGFQPPFLEFFHTVGHDAPCACGLAFKHARRIVVPQVSTDPLFAGTAAAKVMDRAGARACQSTPLVSRSGRLIGMLSTHYDTPHEPSPEELQSIDLIAQRASLWFEGAPT